MRTSCIAGIAVTLLLAAGASAAAELNPAQRKAVPGVAAFYKTLAQRNPQPDLAPIFYLSASPSQLQERIRAFLDLNHFPDGVLVTKKLNRDKSADPWLDQVSPDISRDRG